MVKLILIVEGGETTHPKMDLRKSPDTAKLQEAFYRLLEQEIPRKHLDIRMSGDWITARNRFKTIHKQDENSLLLVDLDVPESLKEQQRTERKLEPKEAMFFMVQEMEAWFLSQPDKIEIHFAGMLRRKETPFASEITKPPKEYEKPSKELVDIVVSYFYNIKKDKEIIPKYRKLRDGAALLELMDLSRLKEDFKEDIGRLIDLMQTKITNA